ncbi:ComEC/Rec2 family competence protein [Sulfurovum riftiae]|uniref:Transporter n=1 Tax=Sulfurovum riftiae TaxID=1630136 RepID=A0A151CF99_9BACT|nr:ComEC/Rec2 family competence protein [Sulfurovum riftiae]KYJ86177.1 transporter [Sulfurovum riftiae]
MEKPKLFESKKSFVWTMVVLFMLFLIHLGWEYRNYTEFISKPFYFTHATVLNAYEKTKGKRSYQVLKLQSDEGLTFYTTTHRKMSLKDKRLRLQIFPTKQITFSDYLGSFYVKSRIRKSEDLPSSLKDTLREKVASQHDDASLASFYNAIFFAIPLNKELREKIALLGVSHLVALSGFHLGILWGLVYGLLLLLYRPLQQRYFPYRYALFDVGMVTVSVLGLYLWFVGFPPSLLRSYAMLLVGWAVLLMGMELLSFYFLFTVAALLLVLFPSLSVSLGFWLSVAGVFYIFLLLQYTRQYNKWMITFLIIPVGIFVLMLPIVHTVFGTTGPYQLLSPLLSVLFIPFYPAVMLLHLLGMGSLFDPALLWLFSLPSTGEQHLFPLWGAALYVALSFAAIRYRYAFYLLLGIAFVYAAILFA